MSLPRVYFDIFAGSSMVGRIEVVVSFFKVIVFKFLALRLKNDHLPVLPKTPSWFLIGTLTPWQILTIICYGP